MNVLVYGSLCEYMFRYRCACAGLVRLRNEMRLACKAIVLVLKWYVEIEQFTKYIYIYMECGLSLSLLGSDSNDNI